MSMKMSCLVVVALIAGLPLGAADLHAQPGDPDIRAGELFDLGQERKQSDDWPGACAAFAESQALVPAAGTLFNLAECREHDERWLAAATLWRETIDAATADGNTARAALAADRLAALVARTPTIEVVAPDGARVAATIDGVAVADLSAAVPVDPGRHEIVVVVDGVERIRTTTTLRSSQHEQIAVDPPRDAITLPIVAVSSARGRNWTAIGLGAGAIALAAVGTYLRIDAGTREHQASDACPIPSACDGTADAATDFQESARLRSQLAVGAFVGAGVVATAAAVLWWKDRRRGRVDVAIAPSGGAITYRASF